MHKGIKTDSAHWVYDFSKIWKKRIIEKSAVYLDYNREIDSRLLDILLSSKFLKITYSASITQMNRSKYPPDASFGKYWKLIP